jgi:hypothetical protein
MTSFMMSQDRLELSRHLHALTVDYWYDVDRNWGRTAPALFTEDGVWEAPDATFSGRDGLRAFYTAREARGGRVVLHAVINFRADFDGSPDRAVATWAMVLWGGDGVPVLPPRPPVVIDYVTEQWVRTAEGWRIRHRKSDALFRGGEVLEPLDLSAVR